jgi:hypothetical protein
VCCFQRKGELAVGLLCAPKITLAISDPRTNDWYVQVIIELEEPVPHLIFKFVSPLLLVISFCHGS